MILFNTNLVILIMILRGRVFVRGPAPRRFSPSDRGQSVRSELFPGGRGCVSGQLLQTVRLCAGLSSRVVWIWVLLLVRRHVWMTLKCVENGPSAWSSLSESHPPTLPPSLPTRPLTHCTSLPSHDQRGFSFFGSGRSPMNHKALSISQTRPHNCLQQ